MHDIVAILVVNGAYVLTSALLGAGLCLAVKALRWL
jgi:hypothetical protein